MPNTCSASARRPRRRALIAHADIASAPDVERLFTDTLDALGRIDVVVHSAGIMPLTRIADGDLAVFDRVIATNWKP